MFRYYLFILLFIGIQFMPIPVASDLLRRLQNRIYPPRPAYDPGENDTVSSAGDTASMSEVELESTSDNQSLDLSNFDTSSQISSSSSESLPQPPTPPIEGSSSGQVSGSSSRPRSSLAVPTASNPDVNTQAALRKRILDIQALNLPEREKARRMQGLMTEAYLEAQRRRRGSSSEQLHQGELAEKDKAKTYHDAAHRILGCQHYRRGAKLQCSTCNKWATCRYCHDEEADHKLIRYS